MSGQNKMVNKELARHKQRRVSRPLPKGKRGATTSPTHEPPGLFIPVEVTEAALQAVDCISPGLYLTGFRGAELWSNLSSRAITHVINLAANCYDNEQEAQPFASKGVEYLCIDISDSEDQDIFKHFDACHAFIAKALDSSVSVETEGRERQAVLVNCAAGISRSATVVLAYLLLSGLAPTLRHAFIEVKARRCIIYPNEGFMVQLLKLEAKLRGNKEGSVTMEEYCAWRKQN